MLNTIFTSLTPQIIRFAVDSIIGTEPAAGLPEPLLRALDTLSFQEALFWAAAAVLAVSALAALFGFLSRTGTAMCSEQFVKSIRDTLFSHIQKLPFDWHTSHQTGEIIQRCTSDVEVIRNFVTTQCLEAFRVIFLVVVSFALMFPMSVKISLVALVFLPAVVIYSLFFYQRMVRRFLAADEAEGELTTDVQENLTGVRVVRAFGREAYEVEKFDQKNQRFSDLWIQLGKLMSVYWASGDLLCGLQILAVLLVGVGETVSGAITPGTLLAFLSYNAAMIWPVRGLGRVLSEMSKAGVSIERVGDILNAQEEQMPACPRIPDWNGNIVFDHVTFGYGQELPVLNDVSFTIPSGKTFAILGGTGSGKSTVAALLTRLYDLGPGQGSITIGGVDLRDIPQGELRRHVRLILQEPFLYSRTVGENIRAARSSASLSEVRSAARTACIDEDIAGMPQGYDTVIGERGVTLSGGQKQRVAIAQALLAGSPVLLMDDALSAVDTQTDEAIRASLLRQTEGRTLILISHRVTTLMKADHILVLDHGRVAEEGTHETLISHDGPYRRVYEIQMNQKDRTLLSGEGSEA